MEKLSMCRICLVTNVRMCMVTNRSLQEMYEKLADVPFVTEDRKPMLACFFCCTRLKQCCQLQRKCVEAKEVLAQMLNEGCERKPLTNRGHLEFVGGFSITPIETISIVDDCQIGSDAIKQELPAVCEGQDDVELQVAHLSEEVDPENLYNIHPDVKTHDPLECKENQFAMEIKIEGEEEHELSEHLRVRETEELELGNPDKSNPGVKDIPAHDSDANSEDDVPLLKIKTQAGEGQEVSKRKRRACVTRSAAVAKKPTLKGKLEDTIPAKQTMNVLSDSKIIRTTELSTAESVAKIKDSISTTSQSSISQFSSLVQHNRIRTGVNPVTCDSEKGNLKKHFRIHIGEKQYKCDVCQRSFNLKGNLKKHSLHHTGEKPYKCDVCQRSFRHKIDLINHNLRHTGEKPYKCDVCQRSYSHKGSLKVHSRLHTGEKPYKCDVCQRNFNQKCNLITHNLQHTGEKPYKCDVCQHSFSQKSVLKKHILQHTGEKPYKCDVCQRSFRVKSYLKIHNLQHTGEKPYKCDICKRNFSQKSILNKHILQHSGEKPNKCDVCQRSFSDKSNLKIHSLKHTGEKPYKCDVCQRSFSRKSYLKIHCLLHTGEKPYKCDVCQHSFINKSNLTVHLRKHFCEKP